ncbi:Uncharacterised protein [Mycobacteroides abscessus subsp. abscessus]|nr:Uncharacterised protein [Mycobacteroides abscessus subsp. abscessus]
MSRSAICLPHSQSSRSDLFSGASIDRRSADAARSQTNSRTPGLIFAISRRSRRALANGMSSPPTVTTVSASSPEVSRNASTSGGLLRGHTPRASPAS